MPVRLEPAALRSQVKHSTTEPLRSLKIQSHPSFYGWIFFKRSKAANSVVGDGIWQKFKLTQAFMVVLITCKNYEDQFKKESTRVLTTFLPS